MRCATGTSLWNARGHVAPLLRAWPLEPGRIPLPPSRGDVAAAGRSGRGGSGLRRRLVFCARLEEAGGGGLNCPCRLCVRARVYSIGFFYSDGMPDLDFFFHGDRVPDQVGAHMGFDSIMQAGAWQQQLRVVTELGCLPGVGIGFLFPPVLSRKLQAFYTAIVLSGVQSPKPQTPSSSEKYRAYNQKRRRINWSTKNLHEQWMQWQYKDGRLSSLVCSSWRRGWFSSFFASFQ